MRCRHGIRTLDLPQVTLTRAPIKGAFLFAQSYLKTLEGKNGRGCWTIFKNLRREFEKEEWSGLLDDFRTWIV
jgi:hypothetical protein